MTSMTLDRHKGHSFSYDVRELGYNYRLDEIRSAMGLMQLKKLDKNNERRENIVELYIDKLKNISWIEIPFEKFDVWLSKKMPLSLGYG